MWWLRVRQVRINRRNLWEGQSCGCKFESCRRVLANLTLRHLTPGMLALVKWTSFLPHIWSLLYQTSTVLLLVHRISRYPFHDHFSSKYPAIIGIRYRMFLGYLRRWEKFILNRKHDTISNLEKIFNISDKSMYLRRQLWCQSHRPSLYQLGWTTWYPFLAVRSLLNDLFCRSVRSWIHVHFLE